MDKVIQKKGADRARVGTQGLLLELLPRDTPTLVSIGNRFPCDIHTVYSQVLSYPLFLSQWTLGVTTLTLPSPSHTSECCIKRGIFRIWFESTSPSLAPAWCSGQAVKTWLESGLSNEALTICGYMLLPYPHKIKPGPCLSQNIRCFIVLLLLSPYILIHFSGSYQHILGHGSHLLSAAPVLGTIMSHFIYFSWQPNKVDIVYYPHFTEAKTNSERFGNMYRIAWLL